MSDSPLLVRDFFARREFCFTMENDVFIRYLCFRDADEFAKAILAKLPHKIDIGPVFSAKVRERRRCWLHTAVTSPARGCPRVLRCSRRCTPPSRTSSPRSAS